MTYEQYKASRIEFGSSVDEWTKFLGISRSLNGKLTGGFVDVSKQTERHIRTLMAFKEANRKRWELEDLIDRAGVREQLYRF